MALWKAFQQLKTQWRYYTKYPRAIINPLPYFEINFKKIGGAGRVSFLFVYYFRSGIKLEHYFRLLKNIKEIKVRCLWDIIWEEPFFYLVYFIRLKIRKKFSGNLLMNSIGAVLFLTKQHPHIRTIANTRPTIKQTIRPKNHFKK